MNLSSIDWPTVIASLAAALGATGTGVVTARWSRKSQAEANRLTGSDQVFDHQSSLLQDIQEERDNAKKDLQEEREANKRDIHNLRGEFEAFKTSVKSQLSGYRAYINGLRGQVHELGGVPIEWPADLEQ